MNYPLYNYMDRVLRHPATLLIALLLAFWPVGHWYVARLSDGSDEPWGILALVTALALLIRPPAITRTVQPAWVLLGLGVYATMTVVSSPLLRAVAAVAVLGYVLSTQRTGRAFDAGLWGLLLFSLPWLATLQFYLGYPMRALTAALAAPWLQFSGFAVTASGAALDWNGLLISVDAPCSGIRMLWMALYLTLALGCWLRLPNGRTLLTCLGATGLVVVANTLRAAALFYLEADVLPYAAPAWLHDAIGLAIFAVLAATLIASVHHVAQYRPRRLRGAP